MDKLLPPVMIVTKGKSIFKHFYKIKVGFKFWIQTEDQIVQQELCKYLKRFCFFEILNLNLVIKSSYLYSSQNIPTEESK